MVSFQSPKEEIKNVADIVEVIGQFVQLRKAGQNHVGLCPFHAEKDPSFTVNPDRQTFHCFGCKKGGDIFSFWMEYHNSTFPEALKDLAERYNISISKGFYSDAEKETIIKRDAFYKINEMASDYFQRILRHPVKGKTCRDYLARRSVSKENISEFRLGYAADEWDGLLNVLRSNHIDLELAVQVGLIIPKKSHGYYDRFRGRIMFPISDMRQHVVAFGGRVLDDSLPKYMNTPETPIFRKGELLYGLDSSHKAIRKNSRVVIVEGYMDCLALRKHGLDEVVATLGTALTSKHVRKLKGYTDKAVIVFDSDKAGKAAALRSLPIFSNEGLSAKAAILPEGHDPDSFINENGLDRFATLIDRASSTFDFCLDQTLIQIDSGVEEKAGVLKELIPILSEIGDVTRRSLYVQRLSEKTGVNESVVLNELEKFIKDPSKKGFVNIKEHLVDSKEERKLGDLQLLNLLVYYPRSVTRLMNCEWGVLFSDSTVYEIVSTFFQKYRQNGPFPPEDLLESLESEPARVQLREVLSKRSFYSDQEVDQAMDEIEAKVHQKKISASIHKVRERGNVDPEALNQLLKLKVLGQPGEYKE